VFLWFINSHSSVRFLLELFFFLTLYAFFNVLQLKAFATLKTFVSALHVFILPSGRFESLVLEVCLFPLFVFTFWYFWLLLFHSLSLAFQRKAREWEWQASFVWFHSKEMEAYAIS
jgi:hypothetical protein